MDLKCQAKQTHLGLLIKIPLTPFRKGGITTVLTGNACPAYAWGYRKPSNKFMSVDYTSIV